jgi:2-methylcitrate dehydratase PrpD
MSDKNLIQQLTDYALRLSYDEISPEALHTARRLVFDTLGTGLGGYQHPLGRKAVTFAEKESGDSATVLGSGHTTDAQMAAFANGVMIKILGMDDSHRSASHIAAQVIPAALAVGEEHGTSGQDLMVALVATYDLAVRVGRAVRFAQRKRGLDVKGTVGSIASALAAGLCARLDEQALAHAVAMAAEMSSGTEQYVYDPGPCDTKDLIAGFAARDGVFATELAKNGFYGALSALDGEYGFFRAFGDGFDPADFADLGQDFAIVTTAFKPHGGCRHTHQAVDAVQDILSRVELDPAQIERVVVQTYRYATEPTFRADADPATKDLAGLSIRVATAVALVHHSAWPYDYAHWDDPEVRRLRHLTDVQVDPEIERAYPEKNGCRVLVTVEDGQTYEGFTPYAKGEPELPVTDAELKEKFTALTRDILPAERVDELFERCMGLEDVPDVGQLLKLTVVER